MRKILVLMFLVFNLACNSSGPAANSTANFGANAKSTGNAQLDAELQKIREDSDRLRKELEETNRKIEQAKPDLENLNRQIQKTGKEIEEANRRIQKLK
jgi:peptidoglycan hydrolase CwlO-like protein